MKFLSTLLLVLLLPGLACAKEIVNVYAWTNEIPDVVVRQFEKESGIKVNISTYENNEIMYAKLRTGKNPGYDIVMPSSYFVDRMRRLNMIEKLDKSQITHWQDINPKFLHPNYDPNLDYSIPHVWGLTGIFLNRKYHSPKDITGWKDLWDPKYKDQLLVLDDVREVFSMALLSLGYSANDNNPEHIKQAFLKLKELMQNIKVFSSDTVASIIIDEDATLGMAWNGDAFKASLENPNIAFVFPKDGFVMWVDNFAIPKQAPHKAAAYKFLDFITRPDIAEEVALYSKFSTTNITAQKKLPPDIRNNPISYPPASILNRGQFQTDVGDEALALFEKYWEELKMGA